MGRNEEVEHPGQYCIVELQGQICTNGASSDRISKNTLKNKGIIMKMRIGRHDIQGLFIYMSISMTQRCFRN